MTQSSIFIDRLLSDEQLIAGLASAFELPGEEIRLINDVTELADDTIATARLACARIAVNGDFALMIECYPFDPAFARLDTRRIVQRLCKELNVRCAISMAENEPYEMWLMDAHGASTLIELDVDDHTGAFTFFPAPIVKQPTARVA